MKEVRFNKVVLNGFRAMTGEVSFKDGLTRIVGANGIGKTRVYSACKWCITGVDELNRTNYKLFDDTADFTPENSTPISVELFINVDGVEYVLKRQAQQKWVRKRGCAEYSKASSDDYKFYIDGLELSATVYKDRIAEIFNMDVEKLKLCMDVYYYRTLDWKELRKHFADLVGEVKNEDFHEDYTDILLYLEKYGGERAKEYLRQQINPLKKQVDDIDADIRATERTMPDLTPVEEAQRQIDEKKARIEGINKEILGLEEANKPFIEKRNAEIAEIRKLSSEYNDKEKAYETREREFMATMEKELSNAKLHNADIDNIVKRNEQAIAKHNSEIQMCKEDIADLSEERERLKRQNEEIKSRKFTDTICPNCGQELPADRIAELHKKFYEDNEKLRAPIVERGINVRARLDAKKLRLEALEREEVTITEAPQPCDIAEIQQRIVKAKSEAVRFDQTPEAQKMLERIKEMDSNLTVVPEVNSAELQEEIKQLVSEVEELSRITARKESYGKCKRDIVNFEENKRSVGIELAKWEGLLDKLMAREREWADIVRDRANKYLVYSHVEMIEINKSGDIIDTCTLSINGVDRSVTNHANKTIIGIDISNAICKRYDVSMPLFIDDFEHFTSDLGVVNNRQVVTLSANPDYSELSIL